MDLGFTAEENAFREEVRAFIRSMLPAESRRKVIEERPLSKADVVNWQRILNAKGWAVPHWPAEWGGTDWTPIQRYIFEEELQRAAAPPLLSFNVRMIGPVLAAVGSDEQKKRFLPATANLDIWWCQGFTEPGSGSDLASLNTRAVRSGDHYVVSGQKIWTTSAQHADWMFALVRTDPAARKQDGISFLLIDMKSSGVIVRPITLIDGSQVVNEVFLDDVRVPVQNLVGEENRGWTYAKSLMGNERTGIARVGVSKGRLRHIRELAATVLKGGRPLIEDRGFRTRLAAIEVELKALEVTQLRVAAAAQRDPEKPNPASSILKIRGSEIQQQTIALLLEVAGPHAYPDMDENEPGKHHAPAVPAWAAPIAPTYFGARKISIYGGTSEIQKNIIAKAILGL